MIFRTILLLAAIAPCAFAQTDIPLVDIRSVDRTIVVELRYASSNNITGRPLYPPGTVALVQPELARRLVIAHEFLRHFKYKLKIWDAYRPRSAQLDLWQASRKNDYVADPDSPNGSLHSWGIAVDATLVDARKRPVRMPTDFDDFTPAAMWRYQGTDPIVHANLILLQTAMRKGGFYGLRSEWWHFTLSDWKKYVPNPGATATAQRSSSQSNPEL